MAETTVHSCDGCGTTLSAATVHVVAVTLTDGRQFPGALNAGLDFCPAHPGACFDLWVAAVSTVTVSA